MVKTPPGSAGNMGLISGLGTKTTHTLEQLSPLARLLSLYSRVWVLQQEKPPQQEAHKPQPSSSTCHNKRKPAQSKKDCCYCCCCSYVASVVSDSVWPHRQQPTGSPIPGILQARTLEWVAISFSNAWRWKEKVKSFSRVWLLATPWTVAYQAPPSLRFSRQKHWSGVPLPSPVRNTKCSQKLI